MAIQINGNGTITGISSGGLPAGCVTSATLASGAGGKILQVLQSSFTDAKSTNSTTFTDTGLSVSITPSSASNKILIMYSLYLSVRADTYSASTVIVRDSSEIFIGDAISSAERGSSFMWPDGGRDPSLHSHTFLDSPNTTSATTYKIQYKSGYSNELVYIGRSTIGVAGTSHTTTPSSLTVMEVAA